MEIEEKIDKFIHDARDIMGNYKPVETDCRSETGVTVGLIDSLIFICRILAERDLTSHAAVEALKDLGVDEDFLFITRVAESSHLVDPKVTLRK